MRVDGVDPEKIKQGLDYIFDYLKENKFSLLETKHLISSTGIITGKLTVKDPLRKVEEFDYLSCIESSFPSKAASNTKS